MMYQLKAALKEDHPNIMVHMSETDLKKWYFLVTNLSGPYNGGEYIFLLKAPGDFPQKPPEFSFITPNGVYTPGGPICISIGNMHTSDKDRGAKGAYGWRSSLGMVGFAREVVNGMIDPNFLEGGIRIEHRSDDEKVQLAAKSVEYNKSKHADIMAKFYDFERSNPNLEVVRLRKMWGAAVLASKSNLQTHSLETLPSVYAVAFGGEAWPVLQESLEYIAFIPDIPVEQLVPMGFRVNGRSVLVAIRNRISEALIERDFAVRTVLVRALAARIQWELSAGDAPGKDECLTLYFEKFQKFLDVLPSACGGACIVSVPQAMCRAALAFSKLHERLAKFLCEQNIDTKAKLGKELVTLTLKEVAKSTPIKSKTTGQSSACPTLVIGSDSPTLAGIESRIQTTTVVDDYQSIDDYLDDIL